MTEIGTQEDLEAFYREYRSPMLRVALSVLRDEGLAEDAVQQAFLKIFQNFEKVSDKDCNKTRPLIVIIVRNAAIDLYRKRGRERVISFEELERPLPQQGGDPEEEAIRGETAEELAGYLSQMEERYANLLTLRYYHGYQNKEIAELLGMSQAQVALDLYRGRQRLKKMMMKGGESDGS